MEESKKAQKKPISQISSTRKAGTSNDMGSSTISKEPSEYTERDKENINIFSNTTIVSRLKEYRIKDIVEDIFTEKDLEKPPPKKMFANK